MKKYIINVKNGFYLGDLCYALDNRVYSEEWGEKHDYEEGKYVDSETDLEFAMVNTAYGDGCYGFRTWGIHLSQDNWIDGFPVDAGIIGIADIDLCKKDFKNLGMKFDYSGKVAIIYDSGTISVEWDEGTVIEIFTGNDYIYLDDYEDEYGIDREDGEYYDDVDEALKEATATDVWNNYSEHESCECKHEGKYKLSEGFTKEQWDEYIELCKKLGLETAGDILHFSEEHGNAHDLGLLQALRDEAAKVDSVKESLEDESEEEQETYSEEEMKEYNIDENGNSLDSYDHYSHCKFCGELCADGDMKHEIDMGLLCNRCADELWSRGEHPVFISEEIEEDKALDQVLEDHKESLKEAIGEDLYFRAFITNLGKYNEGELIGEWVDFPIDEEDFNKILDKIGINSEDEFGQPYEEWFVTDYDCNVPGFDWQDFGEYPSYEKLNDFAEKILNTKENREAIANAYEVVGDIDEAIEGLENGNIYYYPGITSEYELGEYIINERYGGKIPQDLVEIYFDYEALGSELNMDTYENDEYDPDILGSEEYVNAGQYFCGDEDASDYEIGEEFVNQVGIEGVSHIENYFDYEAYGKDLSYEGFTFTSDGVIEQR